MTLNEILMELETYLSQDDTERLLDAIEEQINMGMDGSNNADIAEMQNVIEELAAENQRQTDKIMSLKSTIAKMSNSDLELKKAQNLVKSANKLKDEADIKSGRLDQEAFALQQQRERLQEERKDLKELEKQLDRKDTTLKKQKSKFEALKASQDKMHQIMLIVSGVVALYGIGATILLFVFFVI